MDHLMPFISRKYIATQFWREAKGEECVAEERVEIIDGLSLKKTLIPLMNIKCIIMYEYLFSRKSLGCD